MLKTDRGLIGLTANAADAINAWATAAADTDPRIQMERLIAIRRTLYERRAGELSRVEDARERAYARDMGDIPSYNSPAYRAISEEIAAWEQAHPNVVAEVARRKAADIARSIWQ